MTFLLIVGDDPSFVSTTTLAAIGVGFLHVHPEPAEALRVAANTRPDAVLVDVGGTLDAIDVGRRIRTQYGIPVLHLTERADDERFARARAAEPDGFVQDLSSRRQL